MKFPATLNEVRGKNKTFVFVINSDIDKLLDNASYLCTFSIWSYDKIPNTRKFLFVMSVGGEGGGEVLSPAPKARAFIRVWWYPSPNSLPSLPRAPLSRKIWSTAKDSEMLFSALFMDTSRWKSTKNKCKVRIMYLSSVKRKSKSSKQECNL